MPTHDPCRISLYGVGYRLPDGRDLLENISETLGPESVALIGHNGSGKSTLGHIVAGNLAPTSGRVERQATVLHVAQHDAAALQPGPSLAAVAGLHLPLQALRRLERGQGSAADIELVGQRWDLEARWHALLAQAGLDEARDTPATLSGGQRHWLRLMGALHSDADFLVLDEPGNHLDAPRRAALCAVLAARRERGQGLLLISHDRALLAGVDRTLELAGAALRRYGGGWELVQQQRAAQHAAALERLALAHTERERTQMQMQRQAERAQRKLARGARERGTGSQGRMLLDARRERAEHSAGGLRERHAQHRLALDEAVSAAWRPLADTQAPRFPQCMAAPAPLRPVLLLEGLVGPWGWSRPLDLRLHGAARVQLRGPNGCGKSTLMRLLAGQLSPAQGNCRTPLGVAMLDQSLAVLDPQRDLLAQLQDAAPGVDTAQLRQHLARGGLAADRIARPAGSLSGGERMRGALLCTALRQPTPGLLLLDEPTNHLDLPAIEALEAMLASWPGALLYVSHDSWFAAAVSPTHVLERYGDGWQLLPG